LKLRRQAVRLLELAMRAHERGDVGVREQFIARALRYLEEAEDAEAAQAPTSAIEAARRIAQQQKQVRPKRGNTRGTTTEE
jgi:hypothetical protein